MKSFTTRHSRFIWPYLAIIVAFLITTSDSLKESESGKNDWALQNIGQVNDISFVQSGVDKRGRIFYKNCQLGLFGHLGRKTGTLQSRQNVEENERMIQNTEKNVVIWTSKKQIVKYDKATMTRSVDNKVLNSHQLNVEQVNSYVKTPTKIFISDDKTILEFSGEKDAGSAVKNQINIPTNSVNLKIFNFDETIYSITYYEKDGKICINGVQSTEKFDAKKCLQVNSQEEFNKDKTRFLRFFKKFDNNVFFNVGSRSMFYSVQNHFFIQIPQQSLKPYQFFLTMNAVKMCNGKIYRLNSDHKIETVEEILVEHNHNSAVIFAEEVNGNLVVYEKEATSSSSKNKIATLRFEENVRDVRKDIKRIWVNYQNIQQNQIEIIVQFARDIKLICFGVSKTGANNFAEILWEREESLGYIDRVLFMKYQGYADHLNNDYHLKMDKYLLEKKGFFDVAAEIPSNIILRIQTEVSDLLAFFMELKQSIIRLISGKYEGTIDISTLSQNTSALKTLQSFVQSPMDDEKEKKYGLRKYMIAFTKKGPFFSIDTKTSAINWKREYPQQMKVQKYELISLLKLKEEYEKDVSVGIFYSQKNKIVLFKMISQNGDLITLKQFNQISSKPQIVKISPHSVHIICDNKINQYDINQKLLDVSIVKNYHFYSIEEQSRIVGWKNIGNELIQTWSLNIPQHEKLVKTTSVYRGQPEANLPISNDKRVLFKNVDFSNLAILTTEEMQTQNLQKQKVQFYHRLHLYLINGVTGNIQFHEYQSFLNPDLPINLAYDEHNAIVSYFNTRNRVYQIWSVEGYQLPIESQILSKPYEPEQQKEDIFFRSKVYGTILPIKHMFISESKQALLRRNVMIVTRENKIYPLQRELLSTRRPKSADPEALNAPGMESQADFINTKYPVQQYILPVNPQAYLTHQLNLHDLSNMRFSSTDFQSTIFVFSYGIDCFLIRIAPDKAFDMLTDGFNFAQVLGIIIVIPILAIFFRGKVKQAKLRKHHLQ